MADQWISKIKTKWHPDPGLFKKPASVIARTVASASKSYQQAMNRVTFYENRAGANLTPAHRRNIENAKRELRKIFDKQPGAKGKQNARPKNGAPYWFRYAGGEWRSGDSLNVPARVPVQFEGRRPIAAIGGGSYFLFGAVKGGKKVFIAQKATPSFHAS